MIFNGLRVVAVVFWVSSLSLWAEPQKDLSKDAVARHSTRSDCWIIVDGNVYDLTGVIADHDQYKYKLDAWCGKDATQAWHSKDGKNKPHSRKAQNMLKGLLIGKVSQI